MLNRTAVGQARAMTFLFYCVRIVGVRVQKGPSPFLFAFRETLLTPSLPTPSAFPLPLPGGERDTAFTPDDPDCAGHSVLLAAR